MIKVIVVNSKKGLFNSGICVCDNTAYVHMGTTPRKAFFELNCYLHSKGYKGCVTTLFKSKILEIAL